MKYLNKIDYAAMIYEVLKNNYDAIKTSEYFFSQFTLYKAQNVSFVNDFKETIVFTITERDRILQKLNDESLEDFGGVDFYDGADGNIPFYYIYPQPEEHDMFYNLKKHNYDFDELIILTDKDCEKITRAFDEFLKILPEITPNVTSSFHCRKFEPAEYALTYLFELDVSGQQVPINPTEGTIYKKELMKIGVNRYKLKGDTFYRKVKDIKEKFDINKPQHLEQISKDWLFAVQNICTDWDGLSKYLKNKKLI
jgi:hypothetical protein